MKDLAEKIFGSAEIQAIDTAIQKLSHYHTEIQTIASEYHVESDDPTVVRGMLIDKKNDLILNTVDGHKHEVLANEKDSK